MMEPVSTGAARIRHRTTGELHVVESHELDWDIVTREERVMGTEICHRARVEHRELGELTWSLWEYPEDVESIHETDVNGHELVENLDYRLQHPPQTT
jgi:hypothetical protein